MSEPLLRRAGLMPELPEDGEQTVQLQVEVPIEEAIAPVIALLSEILIELRKLNGPRAA